MNLRIQEVFKYLLPGFVVMMMLFLCSLINFKDIQVNYFNDKNEGLILLLSTLFIFLFGYLVDLLSSDFEKRYYSYFMKPSEKLLRKIDNKIKLTSEDQIISYLSDKMQKCPAKEINKEIAEEYFRKANQLKDYNTNSNSNAKLLEHYYQQVLSRNLSVSFLISIVIYLLYFIVEGRCNFIKDHWLLLIILIFLFTFSLYRWTQHAMYYSRQVFYNSCETVLR
ncbi:hypothetical protein [Myroides odoratimimus]|uniref:SMODS and SLOG-associating 2TM effector domain-containing protein n=1 Tax=Myroides odoratimimus CIP 101113 TaxID=883154 RepID=A0AAV3F6E8_9FLAO|nr:hypothetical protein [Myroides odoratimimus]EHO14583.1 hypothetical protein HMPREF9715_00468 [Myroides odoratimimus CIP 101113]SHM69693.1 hypothetical protein SAMN05444275_12114 [Myroides odoratimimus subsp. xuanwuensis]